MTQERREELETRTWQLSQAMRAVDAEIGILQHGEDAAEPEVLFEIDSLGELVIAISVVRNDMEARSRMEETDDEFLANLFGPPPQSTTQAEDPFPYFASREDLRAINPSAAWDEEATF